MTVQADPNVEAEPWLRHVPVPLFAVVMGIGGLGLAWRRGHEALALPAVVGEAVLALAALLLIAIAALYLAKATRFPAAVAGEYDHPVRINFFPAITISLLIIAAAALPYSRSVAEVVWLAGTAGHLVFALAIFNRWVTRNVEIHHSNPSWFIPVVGNILVPIAGVRLGYGDVSWFFFAIGLVFWVILFAIVLYRIVFHDQLPNRFLPTLFILIAPPAIGFVAYLQLNGDTMDALARILFAVALFTTLLLATMVRLFLRLPFAVSWWAFTFPSAAMAIAALRYYELTPAMPTAAIATVTLAAATAIIALVALRTIQALVAGRLFVPE